MRQILHLQAYDFVLQYIPEADNSADFLSRYITNNVPVNQCKSHASWWHATKSNQQHQSRQMDNGTRNICVHATSSQLTTNNDILLKDWQIVMPTTLAILHKPHTSSKGEDIFSIFDYLNTITSDNESSLSQPTANTDHFWSNTVYIPE